MRGNFAIASNVLDFATIFHYDEIVKGQIAMTSVPPAGTPPSPSDGTKPSDTTPAPTLPASASAPQTMSDFLALFTPKERAQFNEILMKNLSMAMSHEHKRYMEEMRREKEMEGRP